MSTRESDLKARMAAAMARPDATTMPAQNAPPRQQMPLTLDALRSSPLGMLLEAAIAPLGAAGGAIDMRQAIKDRSPIAGILAALAMLPGPMIPGAGKAAAKGVAELGGPGVVLTEKSLLQMAPDELKALHAQLKATEAQGPIQLFGERAPDYERAQRTVNSSMADPNSQRYKAAEKLIDELESNLTPEQEKLLFGIGETGPNADDVRELANLAVNYSDAILADTPTNELLQHFTHLAGGERKAEDLLSRYALPRLTKELTKRGVPDNSILSATLQRMVQRGIPAETAGEALAGRMKAWKEMFNMPKVAPQ